MTTTKSSHFFKTVAHLLGDAHGHHWAKTGPRAAWLAGDLVAFDAAIAAFEAENPEDWGGVQRPAPGIWEHETCTRRTSWVLDNERLVVTLRAEGAVDGLGWLVGATIATLVLDARNPHILVAHVRDWTLWPRALVHGNGDTGAERARRFCANLNTNLQLDNELGMGRALMAEMAAR